jgi:type II secretory pathway pseudopilin PulG
MIVVAIIGILAAIAVPKFADLIRKSQEGALKGRLSTLRSALHVYYADNEGVYPTDSLDSLWTVRKYVTEIPEAFVPGSGHAKSRIVQTNDDLGTAAILTADSGGWLYWNWSSSGAERRWGDVWIGCTHQDAGGQVWSVL